MPKYGATRSLPCTRWAGRLGWLLLLGLLPVTAQGLPPVAPRRAPLAPLPAAPAAGGFHEAEVQRLLQRLGARRLLPEAYALLIRLWEERSRLADPDGLRPVLAAFAARNDLPPLLRSWASWYLAAAEQRVGRLDEARRQVAALGFPPDWRVLGPFQNHGGSGFDEPYLPELEARGGEPPAARYAGVEGDIRWRTLPGLGALGRVDLAPLFARADEVLAYLEVGFALPEDGPIALRVGSADGVKVFVDGVEVHRNPARREAAFDQEAIPLVLGAGWHRLLLKVAHETGGWTSYLRITRLDGGPVPGLRFAATPPDASIVRPPVPDRFPVPPGLIEPLQLAQVALDRARSGKRPQPAVVAEALALRAFLESRLGPADRREGRDAGLYREAVQLAPGRADLFLGLAEALADDENGRRAAFEEALRLSPDNLLAASLAKVKENPRRMLTGQGLPVPPAPPPQADPDADQGDETAPVPPSGPDKQLQLGYDYIQKAQFHKALAFFTQAQKAKPDNEQATLGAAEANLYIYLDDAKNPARLEAADKLLNQALAQNTNLYEVLMLQSITRVLQGKPQQGMDSINRALPMLSLSDQPRGYMKQALVALRAGNREVGVDSLKKAGDAAFGLMKRKHPEHFYEAFASRMGLSILTGSPTMAQVREEFAPYLAVRGDADYEFVKELVNAYLGWNKTLGTPDSAAHQEIKARILDFLGEQPGDDLSYRILGRPFLHSLIYLGEGDAYRAKGQISPAREQYRKALGIFPGNPFTVERLKNL